MSLISSFSRFTRAIVHTWGGGLKDERGLQYFWPWSLSAGRRVEMDDALQVGAVFACVGLLSRTIASMPVQVYERKGRKRVIADGTTLYHVLHLSPNASMTSYEFWVAMITQLALRGNAYAQIVRDADGEVVSMWPLSADQMTVAVEDDGSLTYTYNRAGKLFEINRRDVLHVKGLGNGCLGLSPLSYMAGTAAEALDAQKFANSLSAHGGSPQGALTVDHILSKEERKFAQDRMIDSVQNGNRLVLLEADMKFVPMSLTPAETQLLETRKFSNEEVCRWFGVPPVLVGIPGATTWGSGIAEIVEGFVKFTVGPMLTNIEQSIAKCLLTDAQRSRYQVEFSKDALMRMTPEERFKTWSTAVQNGLMTRNEVRELENRDPIEGGDELTAQTNLAPLQMLGKVASQESPKEKIDDIKQ